MTIALIAVNTRAPMIDSCLLQIPVPLAVV
jgi:hypothetical protein